MNIRGRRILWITTHTIIKGYEMIALNLKNEDEIHRYGSVDVIPQVELESADIIILSGKILHSKSIYRLLNRPDTVCITAMYKFVQQPGLYHRVKEFKGYYQISKGEHGLNYTSWKSE